MSKLDNALAEVWEETASAPSTTSFNAAVLERIAARRARAELGIAALIALGVWAVALLIAPVMGGVLTSTGLVLSEAPILLAVAIAASVFGVLWLVRSRFAQGARAGLKRTTGNVS